MTKPKYLKVTFESATPLTFDEKLQALNKIVIKLSNYYDARYPKTDISILPAIGKSSTTLGSVFVSDHNVKTIHTFNKMFADYTLRFDYTQLDISQLHILATDLILDVDGNDFDSYLDSNRKLNKHKMDYIQQLLNKSRYGYLYEISQYYCESHKRWHQYIEYVGEDRHKKIS